MKVILNTTVPKVGKQHDVVTVADGYARNYLFPRGLAIVAEKKQLEVLERRKERIAAKVAGDKAAADGLREKLNGQEVRIEGKVGGDTSKLFGAITSQDIVDAVKTQLGTQLEKKQVALIDPIKRLGRFEVELDLHTQVTANIWVEVYDPNAIVVVATPAEETKEEE